MTEKLTKMRLISGKFQTLEPAIADGEISKTKRVLKIPGDIVELNDRQMRAFKHQFEDPAIKESLTAKAKAAKLEAARTEKEAAAARAALEAEALKEIADAAEEPEVEAPKTAAKGKK
jgi:hypothetical protein